MDKDFRSVIAFLSCALMGIVFAFIEKHAYETGVLLDEMVTGSIVITDIMSWTIIAFIVIGILVAMVWR